MASFYLIWQQGDALLRGKTTVWQDGALSYPVSFPGQDALSPAITLRSSAQDSNTFETLTKVGFYLTGADVSIVQEQWPYIGDGFTPARPDMSGGFEISFDGGANWVRFDKENGYESDPSTYIPLPASAIGLAGVAGQIGPFDQAHLLMRYVIPPTAAGFKVYDIQLGADFDIV